VPHALNHPTRRRIVEALWHSHEPLSPERFHREFIDDDRVGLDQVVYHLRQLDKDGIIKLDGGEGDHFAKRPFVLAGPNSSQSVRLLGLTPSKPHWLPAGLELWLPDQTGDGGQEVWPRRRPEHTATPRRLRTLDQGREAVAQRVRLQHDAEVGQLDNRSQIAERSPVVADPAVQHHVPPNREWVDHRSRLSSSKHVPHRHVCIRVELRDSLRRSRAGGRVKQSPHIRTGASIRTLPEPQPFVLRRRPDRRVAMLDRRESACRRSAASTSCGVGRSATEDRDQAATENA